MKLSDLRQIDLAAKPPGADEEWARAWRAYNDCSRADTQAHLQSIGAGIKGNARPLEAQLLRRVVDRLALIYARPPTRWFVRAGVRLDEESPEHCSIVETLERSKLDLALRFADKTRTNLRQCVLRYYPSDALGSVVPRVFEPNIVLRSPSPSCPDVLDEDDAFALKIRGGLDLALELWEFWERDGAVWRCSHVDGSGSPTAIQPYRDGECPYDRLPVQVIYDGYPAGQAWLPPRFSRTAWADSINALANDLQALIRHEAHTQVTINTDDTKTVPKEHGPGTVWVLPKDATAGVLSHVVHLKEASEVIENFVRLWTLSEDLPAVELDKSKQVLTGAALKTLSQPLLARRADQVPLAVADEKSGFERYRAVHNFHARYSQASNWRVAEIADDLSLEVEIAELDIPADLNQTQQVGARQILVGTASVIDQIQTEYGISRHQAVKKYAQIQRDLVAYPPRHDPASNPTQGPDGPQPKTTTEEVYGAHSIVDALDAAAAADPAEGEPQ